MIRFSEALAAENAPHGVNVTAVCPGFTYSEFHDVTGTRDRMKDMPGMLWLDAPTVAREGYDGGDERQPGLGERPDLPDAGLA